MSKYPLLEPSELPSTAVIIATLGKRNRLLEQTLESVVNQDIPKLQIVMVYPLSNEKTQQLAQRYNAISIDDPGSMSAAVNMGFKNSWDSSEYLTWIGDDDLLLPGSLKQSLSALEANKNKTATYGYCQYIDAEGKPLFMSKAGRIAMSIAPWGPNLIPLPGSVYRSSSLKKLDYIFDESLKYSMDLDLFLRLRKQRELMAIKYPVAAFRWHQDSTTISSRSFSVKEAESTKRRHLPKLAIPLSYIWEPLIQLSTHFAQKILNTNK